MSPIFVRPVREQAEHDRLIRFLQNKYKRKYEGVATNIGEERGAPVKIGSGSYFPDIVLTVGRKIVGVAEIESAESVNNLEALAQWVPFSRAKIPFTLYVPVQAYEVARRLCDANSVTPAEVWTYRPTFDGFDLIRMFQDPSLAKDDRSERAEKPEKTEKAEAAKSKTKAPAKPVKAVKAVKPAKTTKAATAPKTKKPAPKPVPKNLKKKKR